jgi:hypothetical protein
MLGPVEAHAEITTTERRSASGDANLECETIALILRLNRASSTVFLSPIPDAG